MRPLLITALSVLAAITIAFSANAQGRQVSRPSAPQAAQHDNTLPPGEGPYHYRPCPSEATLPNGRTICLGLP